MQTYSDIYIKLIIIIFVPIVHIIDFCLYNIINIDYRLKKKKYDNYDVLIYTYNVNSGLSDLNIIIIAIVLQLNYYIINQTNIYYA